MKTIENKKIENKKSTKTNNEKLHEQNRQKRIDNFLLMLKYATQRHEKCRIRNQLRKLNHYGALRNRTYFDKNTSTTIIVERKIEKTKTK